MGIAEYGKRIKTSLEHTQGAQKDEGKVGKIMRSDLHIKILSTASGDAGRLE